MEFSFDVEVDPERTMMEVKGRIQLPYIVMLFVTISMTVTSTTALDVDPGADFSGYMEDLKNKEAEAERQRNILNEHEVCSLLCLHALVFYISNDISYFISEIGSLPSVARCGDKLHGAAILSVNYKNLETISRLSLKRLLILSKEVQPKKLQLLFCSLYSFEHW